MMQLDKINARLAKVGDKIVSKPHVPVLINERYSALSDRVAEVMTTLLKLKVTKQQDVPEFYYSALDVEISNLSTDVTMFTVTVNKYYNRKQR